jgi:RNA polymerase sigma factor (sigma-70 family)
VATDPQRAIEAIFRIESPRLIAGLARIVRDVGIAEELAQDAFVAALEQWPRDGVPDQPGAWLMATAKHRAIDRRRRDRRLALARDALEREATSTDDAQLAATSADEDLLQLVFTCCHPVLNGEARVALTLRLLGGLSTAELARAYLLPEATIAQRIVRSKRTLAASGVALDPPTGDDRRARLASVLEVIYLVFNEGYAATAGDDWLRPALCEDALRLARVLCELVPAEPEAHGLAALLELQSSRAAARVGPTGEPVLLFEQDRARWDRLLIGRGRAALARAQALGGARGRYALEAAIAACHARAATPEATDWHLIAALYGALAQVAPSPIVELNRAVAVGRASGPAAGLALVDALVASGELARYHLLGCVRADLLVQLARFGEARVELERALVLTQNERERALLRERAAACARGERPAR